MRSCRVPFSAGRRKGREERWEGGRGVSRDGLVSTEESEWARERRWAVGKLLWRDLLRS